MDRDPNIVRSGLSGKVAKYGLAVDVEIYRLEGGAMWALEVVDASLVAFMDFTRGLSAKRAGRHGVDAHQRDQSRPFRRHALLIRPNNSGKQVLAQNYGIGTPIRGYS